MSDLQKSHLPQISDPRDGTFGTLKFQGTNNFAYPK